MAGLLFCLDTNFRVVFLAWLLCMIARKKGFVMDGMNLLLSRGLWDMVWDYPGDDLRGFAVQLYDNRDGSYSALCCIALQMSRHVGRLSDFVHGLLIFGPANGYVEEYLGRFL